MAYLTKAEILAADDRKFIEVEVPEWGGKVRLASMTAAARERHEQSYIKYRDGHLNGLCMRASMVAACLVDDQGRQVFTAEDLVGLGEKSAKVIGRLFDLAADLNVMTEKAAEEQAGN